MVPILGFILAALYSYASSDEVPHVGPEVLDMLRSSGQDEEFARLLGIEDVSLVRPQEGRSEFAEFTQVSPLGDILLTPEQEEQARQGINFQRHGSYRWPNGRVPYAFGSGEFTSSEKQRISNAIKTLSDSVKNINIVPRTNEEDYVLIMNGNGCWSRLGRNGGQQGMSLQANGCLRPGTIQHEFIHALGMMHEHCRPDRDDYVEVLWDNIPEDWKSQYEKADSGSFRNIGRYEPNSVMHYPENAPGTGKPAFRWPDDSLDHRNVGQREGPTEMDKYKVNNLYS